MPREGRQRCWASGSRSAPSPDSGPSSSTSPQSASGSSESPSRPGMLPTISLAAERMYVAAVGPWRQGLKRSFPRVDEPIPAHQERRVLVEPLDAVAACVPWDRSDHLDHDVGRSMDRPAPRWLAALRHVRRGIGPPARMRAREANEPLGNDSPRPEGMLHVAHDLVIKIASPARQALVLRFEQEIRVAGSEEGASGPGLFDKHSCPGRPGARRPGL